MHVHAPMSYGSVFIFGLIKFSSQKAEPNSQ